MALIHSFEKSGNALFKYRGQIPVVVFILAIPSVYFTDYTFLSDLLVKILTAFAILISFSGFIIRCFAIGTTPKGTSGRNRNEQVAESLNDTGIYSMVRHPLYLGNYLMWAGILVFSFNLYFFILVSLFFWLYYERIMFAEERFLEKKFGNKYLDWSLKVPAFIPSYTHYKRNDIPFSFKSVLRREYSGLLATTVCFAYIDLLRLYFTYQRIEWNRISIYFVAISLILTIVLRTLKHQKLLDEDGRS